MRSLRSRLWLIGPALLAAGALLLMHGLDAHGGRINDDPAHHEDHPGGDCLDCGPLHLLTACLAVTGLAATVVVARRARPSSQLVAARSPRATVDRVRIAPPRLPGWVELSVMRC